MTVNLRKKPADDLKHDKLPNVINWTKQMRKPCTFSFVCLFVVVVVVVVVVVMPLKVFTFFSCVTIKFIMYEVNPFPVEPRYISILKTL